LLYGLLMVVFALFLEDSSVIGDVSTVFGIVFVGPFVFGVSAVMLFGVPAFFASLIYAVLRLYKAWYSYLLVTFVGGCAAHIWIPIIWESRYVQWEPTDVFHVYFALGAVSSVLMAYFVLPQKPIKQTED